MPIRERCVIVGGSHAAAQLVSSLRSGGWTGAITLICDESLPPYHHPPLSKDFLSGGKSVDDLLIRTFSSYVEADVDVKLSTRVTHIDRGNQTVHTAIGEIIPYDYLALTTGARVRRLKIPGAEFPQVFYLRDSRDVEKIRAAAKPGRRALIIGGGYIGLETAASLKNLGVSVTVLEALSRILQRVTAPEVSEFYKRVHTEEGVTIREGVQAHEILSSGETLSETLCVKSSEGETFKADFIVIGIGVIPNQELASDAGLEVGNGIVVNALCQTSDPRIFAAGDVTWHHNPIYDRHLRLESVPNATDQAKTIASFICGTPKPYNSLPWFWSDQFDLKLQIAGLSAGYSDLVLRGDPENGRSFAAFYFDQDRLLAVDAVNSPREFAFGRMMIARFLTSSGQKFDKTLLSNPDVPLKSALH